MPSLRKAAAVMIPKPDKPLNANAYNQAILHLPVIHKLFEKLLLKRLHPVFQERQVILSHQFGFRTKHSTIDQVQQIVVENQ